MTSSLEPRAWASESALGPLTQGGAARPPAGGGAWSSGCAVGRGASARAEGAFAQPHASRPPMRCERPPRGPAQAGQKKCSGDSFRGPENVPTRRAPTWDHKAMCSLGASPPGGRGIGATKIGGRTLPGDGFLAAGGVSGRGSRRRVRQC